jgi:hypothetical protein
LNSGPISSELFLNYNHKFILKAITDDKRKLAFREKICNYIDRAEKLKKIVDEIKECNKTFLIILIIMVLILNYFQYDLRIYLKLFINIIELKFV